MSQSAPASSSKKRNQSSVVDPEEKETTSALVDAASQTDYDYLDDLQKTKADLILFRDVNQDPSREVADLRAAVDRVSLSETLLQGNSKKFKFYTGNVLIS